MKIKLTSAAETKSIVAEEESLDGHERNATPEHETMRLRDIIKNVMTLEKVSQGDLKNKLEMKSQSGVSQALQRDMRVSMALRFLKVLDCKLIVEHGSTRYEVTE